MDVDKNASLHYTSSLVIENTFVNDDFKYAVVNNMREYLEFDDKEALKKEMREAMAKVN